MSQSTTVVITKDPRVSHQPVEALRIALGLAAGEHSLSVLLVGDALRLLDPEADDIVDADTLEKYLPSLRLMPIDFVTLKDSHAFAIGKELPDDCHLRELPKEEFQETIRAADRVLVF